MAIIVVAIHTHPFEGYKYINNSVFYKTLCSTAVPFFFISFGFFLFNKGNCLKIFEYEKKVKLGLYRITKLYLKWTFIFIPITLYFFYINEQNYLFDIILFIKRFFFVGDQSYSWQLWYLLSVIYSLIIIIVFIKLNINFKFIYFISFLILNFSIIITNQKNINLALNNNLESLISYINIFFGNGRLFSGIFYICTGIYISRNHIKLNKSFLIPIIALGLFFAKNPNINIFIQNYIIAATSISIFLLSSIIVIPNSVIWFYIRKTSIIMYFTHMLFFFIYTLIFYKFPHYGLDSFGICLLGTIIVSLYLLIKPKEKILNFAFS